MFHLPHYGFQLAVLAGRTYEDDFGIAVIEYIQVFIDAKGRVDRYMDKAGHTEPHVCKIPFRTVVADAYRLVPLSVAQRGQRVGNQMGIADVVLDTEPDPFFS